MHLLPSAKNCASLAVACFAYALLTLLLLHGVRADYAPASHMISDYAVGPFGWLMVTVFLALSIGIMALLVGLLLGGPKSSLLKVGTLLLGITSAGLVVSALYSTDLPGMPDTAEGNVHAISFLVNILCLLVATPLISLSFGSDPLWRSYRNTALPMALLVVFAFALQVLTLRKGMPYGLTNRIFVVSLLLWLGSTAFALRNVSERSARSKV